MVSRRQFLRDSLWLSLAALSACGGADAAPQPRPIEPPSPLKTPGTSASLTPSPAPLITRASLAASPAAPLTGTTAPTAPTGLPPAPPTPGLAYLAVARGDDPARITRAAVDALGGMRRFVKPGTDVIIKPNICTASYPPEYAATTNPIVVSTLVQMCLEAGAGRVRAMDFPFAGVARQAYVTSGIQAEVERAGGQMELMGSYKYAEYPFPSTARDLKTWSVYQDILKADVLINVPIAKHHSLARVTLGMKNLMGVVQDRNGLHRNLNQRLADLATLIRPALNVVDAVRVLQENGPTGGSLDYVRQANTVIASADLVAADAYAASEFFGLSPDEVGYIRIGQEMNLGRLDFDNLQIEQIQL